MLPTSIFTCSLIFASANAIQMGIKAQQPANTSSEVAMQETAQALIDNFDPSTIVDWWNEVYAPFLTEHRDTVYNKVWSEIVERDDPFMPDTCEAGHECMK